MTESLAWSKYLRDKDARAEAFLVKHYAYLVNSTLHRHMRGRSSSPEDREDFECNGQEALLAALRSFDPSQAKFQTWAIAKIKAAMLEGDRSADVLSRQTRSYKSLIEGAALALTQENGCPATSEQIAVITRLPLATVELIARTPSRFDSMDAVSERLGESGRMQAEDLHQTSLTSASDFFDDPMLVALRQSGADTLWGCVDRLLPRTSAIVRRYYKDGATLACIGREQGISESRVYQIIDNGKERLRYMLEGTELDEGQALEPAGTTETAQIDKRKLAWTPERRATHAQKIHEGHQARKSGSSSKVAPATASDPVREGPFAAGADTGRGADATALSIVCVNDATILPKVVQPYNPPSLADHLFDTQKTAFESLVNLQGSDLAQNREARDQIIMQYLTRSAPLVAAAAQAVPV